MPPRIKGLRDIRTHGSLDREGRLPGVAKNLGKIGINIGIGGLNTGFAPNNFNPEQSSWNGSVKPIRRAGSARTIQKLPNSLQLNNARRESMTEDLNRQIIEMRGFVKENIKGAEKELARLKEKLEKLQK